MVSEIIAFNVFTKYNLTNTTENVIQIENKLKSLIRVIEIYTALCKTD